MAVNITESDFYSHQQKDDNRWRFAVLVAVGLHLGVLGWSLIAPDLLSQRPLLDEAVIVDLVSLPEPPAQTQDAPAVQQQPPVEQEPSLPPEPEPVEEALEPVAVPLEPEVPPEPVVAAQPVSVKPLKRKIKKAADTRLAEEKAREERAAALREKEQQRLERQRQERLEQERQRKAAALARAEQARKEADRAARDARQALAEMYRRQGAVTQSQSAVPSRKSGNSGRSKVQSVVAQQYYAALYQHIQGFWVLPEMRKWDPSLEARVVVVINQNGQVLSTTVEKKSKDAFFNQLVVKTLHSAAPMPRFPNLMKERTIEVGLRFRPGNLEM